MSHYMQFCGGHCGVVGHCVITALFVSLVDKGLQSPKYKFFDILYAHIVLAHPTSVTLLEVVTV